MQTYKHAATISSQLYFCSSPIRLDSYNKCQFGCVYCFSRNRSMDTSTPGLKAINADAFDARLKRIESGVLNSAFDEFLYARVPIQLGGMQDPFSSFEKKHEYTLKILKILEKYNYPTLISTKSLFASNKPYISILKNMNVLVRMSAAGIKEECRSRLEIGCPQIHETMESVSKLSNSNIPVSFRIQPVIPGHENEALQLAKLAGNSGAKHISFEYLKIATEEKEEILTKLSEILGYNLWDLMNKMGIKRVGRDYTLETNSKSEFLKEAKKTCHSMNIKFGAGDTEFIHLSDGNGCCNGSSFFLEKATQFNANFIGVLSNRKVGDKIFISDIRKQWQPEKNVHSYLTTNSRGRENDPSLNSWEALISHRWNGKNGPYSPSFFYGIEPTGKFDHKGYMIYFVEKNF